VSAKVWLAVGYALLMWAVAWGLKRHAGTPNQTWVGTETVAFARAIALVPLAVGDAVLVGAAVLEPSAVALVILLPLFVGLTRTGWRELAWLRAPR
jgi:hypothetical protein